MKLSKREKALLALLGVVILLVSYYKFIFIPQRNAIATLEEDKTIYEDKVNKLNTLIAAMPQKESDIKVITTKIKDKSVVLYPEIIQENIIRELDKLMVDSGVYGNISFSEVSFASVEAREKSSQPSRDSKLSEFKNQYNNTVNKSSDENTTGKVEGNTEIKKNNVGNESSNENKEIKDNSENNSQVEQLKVSLNFKGSYKNVVDFVKSLENYSKHIAMVSINLSQSSETEIAGTSVLEFFAIPKITDEDKDYLKWDLQNPYGKENIFDGTVGITPPQTVEEINTVGKPKYDFVMSLKPQSSDIPTIILGRANDKERKTYVYADSNKVEDIEIVIEKENEKYYYKYKTSRDSYPINFNEEKVEFNPGSSEIYFNIISSLRLSAEDKSGAKIKLINKADKKIVVSVEGEDTTSPRVRIEGEGGNIEVKQVP